MGEWTGTVPTFAAGSKARGPSFQELADIATALTGAWTSYSPTWTASSSNPAIGNGSISTHYMRVGSLVGYKGVITMGSTTTFGSGYWILTMPVSASLGGRNSGVGLAQDSSATTNSRPAAVEFLSATTFRWVSSTGRVDATNPFTWATSDTLTFNFLYEAA